MADERIEDAKADLRRKAQARRAAISTTGRAEAASAVADLFFEQVPIAEGQVVAAYWRIRDELDCQPIIVRLMDANRVVVLPVVTGEDTPLELRVWQPGEALYEAGFGTLAPAEQAPRAEPDIMLMPLLGFDAHGTRLGYGGGYYDRTLASLSRRPHLIGLAYAAQQLDHIPRDAHDVPLDAVITEQGMQTFGIAA